VAAARECPLLEVAGVYFALSERFRVDAILSRISALPRENRWQTLARMALRYDLYAALAALTSQVLGPTSPAAHPADRVFAEEQRGAAPVARARAAIDEVAPAPGQPGRSGVDADLAALSVLLRQIRALVRTVGA